MDEVKKIEANYKRQIIYRMKKVGTYNHSFMYTINVLAKVLADYTQTLAQFQRTGGQTVIRHTNKSGATNIVKNPLYLSIEKQQDDIVRYSRELGLTPSGLKKIKQEGNAQKQPSKLEKMLSKLGSR